MRRFALTVLLLFVSLPASAESLGPLLRHGVAEAGAQITWRNRSIDFGLTHEDFEMRDASLTMRYGLNDAATISAELMAGNESLLSQEEESRFYVLGGGIQARITQAHGFLLSGGLHYTETMYFDLTGDGCDARTYNWTVSLQVERSVLWRRLDAAFWGGPIFMATEIEEIGGANCKSRDGAADGRTGFFAGVNVVLWDHFQVSHYAAFTGYYHPRIVLSYRF